MYQVYVIIVSFYNILWCIWTHKLHPMFYLWNAFHYWNEMPLAWLLVQHISIIVLKLNMLTVQGRIFSDYSFLAELEGRQKKVTASCSLALPALILGILLGIGAGSMRLSQLKIGSAGHLINYVSKYIYQARNTLF